MALMLIYAVYLLLSVYMYRFPKSIPISFDEEIMHRFIIDTSTQV